MKPATNIIELFKNLSPIKFLRMEDEAFYVPIYEDVINRIRFDLLTNEVRSQTIYTYGQTGTGKTTALNFLPNNAIEEQFAVIPLYANELFDLNDIDVIDLLLMVSYKLIEDNKSLGKEFHEELQRIRDKHEGREEAQTVSEKGRALSGGGNANAELGKSPIAEFFNLFKLGAGFFANLKMEKSYREITRRAFVFRKPELLGLANRIIGRYLEKAAPGKDLLLVFNELDHIKKPELIEELFVGNRHYFENLECKKVISIPVSLRGEPDFPADLKIHYFGLKLRENPLAGSVSEATRHTIEENRRLLKTIVVKRMSPGADLIEDKAIEEAIEKSGGIIRQFLAILHNAARNVAMLDGKSISLRDVEEGAIEFRQNLERSIISKEKIEILDLIRKEHKPKASRADAFIEALLGNQVLIYENDPTWYALNPLIENTVKIYAEQSE